MNLFSFIFLYIHFFKILSKLEHPEKIAVSEMSKDENPSFILNNVEVRMNDLESLAPGKMVNDVMATALLKYVCAW